MAHLAVAGGVSSGKGGGRVSDNIAKWPQASIGKEATAKEKVESGEGGGGFASRAYLVSVASFKS